MVDIARQKHIFPWKNGVGLYMNNTSVVIGKINSIITQMMMETPDVHYALTIIPTHAKRATSFCGEIFVIDNSTKGTWHLFYLCNIFCKQFLIHVCVFSLHLSRALKSYLLSESDSTTEHKILKGSFGNPMTQLHHILHPSTATYSFQQKDRSP